MVVKHEKKSRKKLGYNHHNGLRRRGSGNRGGFGRAGVGKRGKQKKHKFMVGGKIPYGKHGFTSKKVRIGFVTLSEINTIALHSNKDKDGKYHIDLGGKKVLGSGTLEVPVVLSNYSSITERAAEKVKKAGGELVEK